MSNNEIITIKYSHDIQSSNGAFRVAVNMLDGKEVEIWIPRSCVHNKSFIHIGMFRDKVEWLARADSDRASAKTRSLFFKEVLAAAKPDTLRAAPEAIPDNGEQTIPIVMGRHSETIHGTIKGFSIEPLFSFNPEQQETSESPECEGLLTLRASSANIIQVGITDHPLFTYGGINGDFT